MVFNVDKSYLVVAKVAITPSRSTAPILGVSSRSVGEFVGVMIPARQASCSCASRYNLNIDRSHFL
jgi:hypothetical protein